MSAKQLASQLKGFSCPDCKGQDETRRDRTGRDGMGCNAVKVMHVCFISHLVSASERASGAFSRYGYDARVGGER